MLRRRRGRFLRGGQPDDADGAGDANDRCRSQRQDFGLDIHPSSPWFTVSTPWSTTYNDTVSCVGEAGRNGE